MEINYAPIINRINYLSENILCLKNDKIVTEIYLKSLKTKKSHAHVTHITMWFSEKDKKDNTF